MKRPRLATSFSDESPVRILKTKTDIAAVSPGQQAYMPMQAWSAVQAITTHLSYGSRPRSGDDLFLALQPGSELLLLLATWLALRLRLGLRTSDVGRYLAHEFLKVVQVFSLSTTIESSTSM